MYTGLHVKYRLFLSDFNNTWILSPPPPKNTQMSIFMKIRPVGGELFHSDRRDVAKSRFSQFLITHLNLKQQNENYILF